MNIAIVLCLGFVFAVCSGLLARWVQPGLVALLESGGLTGTNYDGRSIPTGAGIILPFAALVPLLAATVIDRTSSAPVWIAVLFGMGFIGFLDDAAGDRNVTGLSGHLGALLRLKPTTGSIKALVGGLLAFHAGWSFHGRWVPALLAAILVALCANGINLLDIRPGRALKGFAVLCIAALAAALQWGAPLAIAQISLLGTVIGGAAVLWAPDHGARLMIGDAGSNVLGASVGLALAAGPWPVQATTIVFLGLFHAFAERESLTELIQATPVLDRIDRWGRP